MLWALIKSNSTVRNFCLVPRCQSGIAKLPQHIHQQMCWWCGDSWPQGGKAETSGETGERLQYQQHQIHVAGDPEHHRLQNQECPIMCEAKFYFRFDLLNKESAVKSTPLPDDRPLSISAADVRRTLLRRPDNIPGCVLITCQPASWCHLILSFFTSHCHKRVFLPASRHPPLSLYLKGLQCLV